MNLAYLLPPEIKELGLFPPNTTIWEGNVPEFSLAHPQFFLDMYMYQMVHIQE